MACREGRFNKHCDRIIPYNIVVGTFQYDMVIGTFQYHMETFQYGKGRLNINTVIVGIYTNFCRIPACGD